jgi:hypothetical protein
MADISQTAANVGIGSSTTPTEVVTYGETITQGQPLYKSTTDSKWYRCDNNDGIAKAVVGGIALTPGVNNSFGLIAKPSSSPGKSLVNLGATLTVGETYIVSANVGGIAPIADIASTRYVTILGVATTAALLDFRGIVTNIQRA